MMLTQEQVREEVAKLINFINIIDEPNKTGCLRLFKAHKKRIINAPGSKSKHQAYPTGYMVHYVDMMEFAVDLFPLFQKRNSYFPDFTLSDIALVLWFHDKEKPWK